MIRCTKCGTINPDDAIFCSNCKSFLEWTGVPIDRAEAAAAVARGEAASPGVAESLGVAEPVPAPAPAPAPAPEPEALGPQPEAPPAADVIVPPGSIADAKTPAAGAVPQPASSADADGQAAADKAAAEQAAADKAAAEQAAADKAVADMAAAEREAADKAAADKAAAEQAAAARAAAERAAAEQAAAQRAAAAKAAAEQAAAAQAAAERAAAEQAAAQRAAADMAAAEQAAAAKAAAEQAAAAQAAAEQAAAEQASAARTAAALFEPLASSAAVPPLTEAPDEPPAVRPTAVRPTSTPPPRRPVAAPSDQPAARQPTLSIPPVRPRPQSDAEAGQTAIQARPGDLICGVCGTPNDPARRFCRRCGNSLAAAVAAPKPLPWWRRLFQRNRPAAAAGWRPKRLGEAGQPRPGTVRQVVPLLAIAALGFMATSLVVMPGTRAFVEGAVTDLRLRFLPQIVDIHPVAVTGQGVGANYAKLAVDDNTATFWLADPAAGAPTLTVDLGSTVNLGGLVVHSGSSTQSDFPKHRRPRTIELTFPGTTRPAIDLELKDTSDPQPVSLDVRGVETVVIRVVDWFESGAGGDELVAIREIEFKERR